MRRIAVTLLGVSVAAFACNAITGIGDLEAAGDDCVDDCRDAASEPAPLPPAACDCRPVAPEGWSGPLSVLESSAGAPPSCAGSVAVFEGGREPRASGGCTPCTCGAPVATCAATVALYGNPSCASSCGSWTAAPGQCTSISYCSPNGGAKLTQTLADGGCAPDGGLPAPWTWRQQAVGCAAASVEEGRCGSGQACSPAVVGARVCIARAGDDPCPAGPYQSRVVYYASAEDDRACAPCACDPPSGVTCADGGVALYTSSACSGNGQELSGAGCENVVVARAAGSLRLLTPPIATGGSCAPRGGEPVDGGAVTPSEPTTVCCLP